MIYLLRHGETAGSGEKRYIGQTDVHLSPSGRAQAAWWKKKLAHVEFEAVYASDLTRAFETAKIVSSLPDRHIQVLPQLREINLGAWEGVSMERIRCQFPDAWEERGKRMDLFRTPNGESFMDLHARVIPVFQKIAAEPTGNVLLVAHAGVNRIILCHALKRSIRELFSIPQGDAALNLIDFKQGKPVVVSMNVLPATTSLRDVI